MFWSLVFRGEMKFKNIKVYTLNLAAYESGSITVLNTKFRNKYTELNYTGDDCFG